VALVILTAATPGLAMLASLGLGGDLALTVAASVGGAAVMLLVLVVANRIRSSITLLILGLMIGYAVSALVSLLIYFSIPERIQAYSNWTFGSFGGVTWSQMIIFAPAIMIGLVISFLLAKPLNALLLGEAYAATLGVRLSRIRLWIIVAVGLLAGAVTAFCGPIGFLGIAAPHLGRAMGGTADHRVMLPTSMLIGAIMALIADFVAQLPGSQTVLPLNAVTALVGAPVVIFVILRGRSLKSSFG
jgi:iron complex transport system permease protein